MTTFFPEIQKHCDLALAAIEDASIEASQIFASAIFLIAKHRDPDSFRALATLCDALDQSGLWPHIEPVGIALKGMGSPSSFESSLPQLLTHAKVAKALIQMSVVFSGPKLDSSGRTSESAKDFAAHPMSMLDQDVATCLSCRWGRLPLSQAQAEVDRVKSGQFGSSNLCLPAIAERFLVSQGLARVPERTAAARL